MQIPKIKNFSNRNPESPKTGQNRQFPAPDLRSARVAPVDVSNAQKMKVTRETRNDDCSEQITIFDVIKSNPEPAKYSLSIVTGDLEFYGE